MKFNGPGPELIQVRRSRVVGNRQLRAQCEAVLSSHACVTVFSLARTPGAHVCRLLLSRGCAVACCTQGRLAMLAMVVVPRQEIDSGATLVQQAAAAPAWVYALLLLWVYASLVPMLKGARHEAFGTCARCGCGCVVGCSARWSRRSCRRALQCAHRHQPLLSCLIHTYTHHRLLHAACRGAQRACRHAGLCHPGGPRVQGWCALLLSVQALEVVVVCACNLEGQAGMACCGDCNHVRLMQQQRAHRAAAGAHRGGGGAVAWRPWLRHLPAC
jgi:hypothetical protein